MSAVGSSCRRLLRALSQCDDAGPSTWPARGNDVVRRLAARRARLGRRLGGSQRGERGSVSSGWEWGGAWLLARRRPSSALPSSPCAQSRHGAVPARLFVFRAGRNSARALRSMSTYTTSWSRCIYARKHVFGAELLCMF